MTPPLETDPLYDSRTDRSSRESVPLITSGPTLSLHVTSLTHDPMKGRWQGHDKADRRGDETLTCDPGAVNVG